MSARETMPLGPGFYMPCGAFFDADYMAADHIMSGCAQCESDLSSPDSGSDQ